MIRVLVGYWIVIMSAISLILCIVGDDFGTKLLVVESTAIFLAALLFGMRLIEG